MTRLSGRLAAGMAAIMVGGLWGTPVNAAINSPPVSVPSPATDTAPTAEKPVLYGADDLLSLLQQRYVGLFDKFHTAVVRVNVVPAVSPDTPPQVIVWTGFFISRNGDILTTNADKLQNKAVVYITDGDGIVYRADVLGTDLVTNLALLHVQVAPKKFTVLDLAENSESPPIGSLLLAITSKQGQTPGPSAGMVQQYNVNFADVHLPTLHLRVNIPDDSGETGAPVLDLQGRLVGIMVWGLPESRSSLVLPARAALRVRDDLLTHGKVAYGQLGFEIEQKSDPQTGVVVVIKSVTYDSHSPALAAGLKVGDVLKSVGTTPINSDLDLRQAWFFSRPGQDLPIVVQRGDVTLPLTLHVGEMPVPPPPKTADDKTPSSSPPAATNTSPLASSPEPDYGQPPPVIIPKGK